MSDRSASFSRPAMAARGSCWRDLFEDGTCGRAAPDNTMVGKETTMIEVVPAPGNRTGAI